MFLLLAGATTLVGPAEGRFCSLSGPDVPRLFTVTFIENGLPGGSLWSLSVGGHTWNTSNSSLPVQFTNGTYAYSAFASVARTPSSPTGGYLNGSFAVVDQPRIVELNWSYPYPPSAAAPSSSRALFGPLPGGGAAIALALVLVAAVGVAIAVAVRGRRVSGPDISESESPVPAPPTVEPPPAGAESAQDPLGHML